MSGSDATIRPFDDRGVERRADGSLGYSDLPRSLVHMLDSATHSFSDREAIAVVGGERLSYADLWQRAARTAGGLRSAGIERGDRVAIRLPNGAPWVIAFWGVQLAGGIAVPVNTRFSEAEVQYVVEDSGAKLTLDDGENLPDGDDYVDTTATLTDLAAIFYTSGTTGFPKGAMTTHENFLSNIETCIRCTDLNTQHPPRNLISVPLFHVTGCNSQLLPTLQLGGLTVIMPEFDVQVFLRTIVDEQIDTLITVPAIYWLAMNQPNIDEFDLTHVKTCTYGGAPSPPHVIARLREVFVNAKLGNGYGLTETSSVATLLPDEYCDERPETVGFTSPVCEARIDDVDTRTGEGELLLRGQSVVAGYWNKPEATEATFVDRWLHTGDVARIDEAGFIQIVDRAKDMINRGGENVYCVEVENALLAHPLVFEAAVLGVPDEMMGEKVGAVVVPVPDSQLDTDDLIAFLRERIADFKVPQYVSYRTELLPRNPGGKILKPRLRELIEWGDPLR